MKDFIKPQERINLNKKQISYMSSVMIAHEEMRLKDLNYRVEALYDIANKIKNNIKVLGKKVVGDSYVS